MWNAPTPWEFKNPWVSPSGHLGFLQSRLRSLKFKTHFSPWENYLRRVPLGHDGAFSVTHSTLIDITLLVAAEKGLRGQGGRGELWVEELGQQPSDDHSHVCHGGSSSLNLKAYFGLELSPASNSSRILRILLSSSQMHRFLWTRTYEPVNKFDSKFSLDHWWVIITNGKEKEWIIDFPWWLSGKESAC